MISEIKDGGIEEQVHDKGSNDFDNVVDGVGSLFLLLFFFYMRSRCYSTFGLRLQSKVKDKLVCLLWLFWIVGWLGFS